MPVYEYECDDCHKILEIQQKLSEPPLTACPECDGPVRKVISMTSFQLKGGGWYADGYSSAKDKPAATPAAEPAAPPCQSGASCASCPAAASGK